MEDNLYSGAFPLENSLCKDCIHRFSKIMIPIDYESIGIDIEDLCLGDEDELFIEQHTCLVTHEDISGIVKKCSHFKKNNKNSFFYRNPY